MTWHLLPTIALLLAAPTLTSSSGTAQPRQEIQERGLQVSQHMGLVCMWALLSSAGEVGRRCRAGRHPQFQAELERSVSRFEDHVVHTSGAGRDQVAQFSRRMAEPDVPEGDLCVGDPLEFHDGLAGAGSDALRVAVDEMLRRPGPPEWGVCL